VKRAGLPEGAVLLSGEARGAAGRRGGVGRSSKKRGGARQPVGRGRW
jgi:hypothetical protein